MSEPPWFECLAPEQRIEQGKAVPRRISRFFWLDRWVEFQYSFEADMVKIRLARYGTKKRPYYRIMVADSRQSRDGKFIEILGTYDPMNLSLPKDSTEKREKGLVTIKTDRLQHWLSVGAQVSPTVTNILKREKLLGATPAKAA